MGLTQVYLSTLEEFKNMALSVGADAESLSGLTRDVWNDAIREEINLQTVVFVVELKDYDWDDLLCLETHSAVEPYDFSDIGTLTVTNRKGFNDFNKALSLLAAHPTTVNKKAEIENGRREVTNMYLSLGNSPVGLERAQQLADDLYAAFDILVSLSVNPTGSFQSYSESRRDSIDEFMRQYRLLSDIIDLHS